MRKHKAILEEFIKNNLYMAESVLKILKLNSVVLVCERIILIKRPPLVGEVSANFCGYRVQRGQCYGSLWPYFRLSIPKLLLFLPSSSSIVLTRLGGPLSRPTTSQKNLVLPRIEPGPLDL
jgi:hypothetical protein